MRATASPCARSSARVEETSGASVPSSAVRSLWRRVQQRSLRLVRNHHGHTQKRNACLSHTPGVVVVGWFFYSKSILIVRSADDFFR